jgi:N,N'-diacetyllegionaminate synthase
MAEERVFIIAEAGVNHNGSIGTAKELIDAAAMAGADAVKFQTFKAESMVSRRAPKAGYQKKTTGKGGTQFEMLKRLELDAASHKELIRYCRRKGIIFLSSPFDLDSVELLDELGLEIFKVPSGEITNLPYLKKIGALNKKVIMSTGMSNLKEIREALDILVSSGTRKQDITVLHCVTEYPAPAEEVNLKAMLTIKKAFNVKVGYSDHTLGIEIPIAAVALGASVIEKHVTLNRNMNGPDHRSSIEPNELEALVKAVRNVEKALGTGVKKPTKNEEKNKNIVRKSIVAKRNIPKGMRITGDMLDIKRPGTGIEPKALSSVVGRRAGRAIEKDALIKIKYLI